MGSEIETLEERLNSFLVQLQAECRVFERMVYKNKNQHRRCSYFQYLLKVRRDLRLLQSSKLEEIVGSCFHVITGRKPRQKVHLLESLKWRKCDSGTPNFMERLLGAARLLSQIVEPMLKAATDISTLLARSFFMGFSLTILALLARLRVLVQQILLDVVSVFNMVSSLSQEKQSVKITQEGLEVFREYYPTNKEFVTLECVWKTDKFVLVEKTHKIDVKGRDGGLGDGSIEKSVPRYWTIESFLGVILISRRLMMITPPKKIPMKISSTCFQALLLRVVSMGIKLKVILNWEIIQSFQNLLASNSLQKIALLQNQAPLQAQKF
ncbi:hypothetical protein H0E87_021097 [Populus deltoides]|uniref:Nucleolus and neural progenitor protein-like N-terminal domain-containing protein n=1 Tax=Populus deltoides TaxID=3696 RepID=A0A8T2XQ63_POPDE|nr:hypothetical protein H0E87_021097 [Populus deltoides]